MKYFCHLKKRYLTFNRNLCKKYPELITPVYAWFRNPLCLLTRPYDYSLDDLIHYNTQYRVSWTEIFQIAQRAAEAIKVIHDLGITHNDIKPGSFLIKYQGGHNVYLNDFGCANVLGEEREERSYKSKALIYRYIAPEVSSNFLLSRSIS